ncbi:uncharacterized protein LOC111444465 isoform X1 [Cucurbita moschata]|uniref:Uncharacterized protein LOC111444465 isoform X1 n=2 Tax=Cucurbita moschata TaxID=3662 RepID=A0A6J1FCV2_CUCMO|nr:uncharacterized protein LOC111444465 isoform X1 [Cucurbita moschata]
MPRPGPRPYECVRRAWHSDRHQPMRGSIIQQIFRFWVVLNLADSLRFDCVFLVLVFVHFGELHTMCLIRVVNENHSPATKKNKEWQEKLPIVVLKAEEIMYSKANSEVEYMNLETVWERLNDAVNTIIRRDEHSETGELLPPCVEAALNLGCVPVRASRSQRHTNPRTYLTPRTQEPSTLATTLDKASDERPLPTSLLRLSNQLSFPRATAMNSSMFGSEHNSPTIPSNPAFLIENVHNYNYSMTDLGSVYPLYYGIRFRTEEPNVGSRCSVDANQQTIFLGRPVVSSAEPAELSLCARKTGNAMSRFPSEVITDTECDLSLRLGVPSQPCVSTGKPWASETGDIGSSSSHERNKFHDRPIYATKEFTFFPNRTSFDPSGSCSNMWSSDWRGQNPESFTKKRKEPIRSDEEDEPFCLPPEAPSNWFGSRTKRPGL